MTSVNTPVNRTLLHTRSLSFHGYKRDDGLWDIEASMRDERAYQSYGGDAGTTPPGSPIHDLHIRLTVDDTLTVREISSAMHTTPVAECSLSQEPLLTMIGTSMATGWRQSIESRMGGTKGCTHLRELLFNMATVAYQTIPVYQAQLTRQAGTSASSCGQPPFHLGKCLALAFNSPAVKRLYPKHYRSDQVPSDDAQ